MKSILQSVVLWFFALVITLGLAGYQRRTGPSYPLRGTASIDGVAVSYALPRSHGGAGGLVVLLKLPAGLVEGADVVWRRYPTQDPWSKLPMNAVGGGYRAGIPHQPAAGKVEYRVVVRTKTGPVAIPGGQSVVARFRGDVPAWLLIPHILCMFIGMLLATRGLLEVLVRGRDRGRGMVLGATGLLVLGGLVLGPLVQLHAFGALWTGWPLGGDLTDNKTLLAILAWLPAALAAWKRRQHPVLLATGWAVMMAVFLIPHSMRGSQLDWTEQEQRQAPSREIQPALDQRSGGDQRGTGRLDSRGSANDHVRSESDVSSDHELSALEK